MGNMVSLVEEMREKLSDNTSSGQYWPFLASHQSSVGTGFSGTVLSFILPPTESQRLDLTAGRASLLSSISLNWYFTSLKALAALLESGSEHKLAQSWSWQQCDRPGYVPWRHSRAGSPLGRRETFFNMAQNYGFEPLVFDARFWRELSKGCQARQWKEVSRELSVPAKLTNLPNVWHSCSICRECVQHLVLRCMTLQRNTNTCR